MRESTLCFLFRGSPPAEILLGLKKRGFGAGKYDGFGGKVEPGETVEHATLRELTEETGLTASERDLERVAHLTFVFPHKPEWSQVVHTFRVRAWQGEPAESAEMKPQWFALNAIPFAQMWQDAAHWLPPILNGQTISAHFTFRADNETIAEMHLENLASL
jgi:8-oxo-dGTP diphosphatase